MATDDIMALPGRRSIAVKLAALGMISGAISWGVVDLADQLRLDFRYDGHGLLVLPVSIYPGLIFGVIFGAVLRLLAKAAWPRVIGYVVAAVLGYGTAFHVTFYIVTNAFSSPESALAYIVAGVPGGLAGSLLLGLKAKLLFHEPARPALLRSIAVGTAAGALLGLASLGTHNGWGFLAFFVLWQGAYGASLAPFIQRTAGASGRRLNGS